MKRILLITILILMIATPVMAQSTNYYHEVELQLDGEWEWNSTFAAPDVLETTALKGTGKAIMRAITKAQVIPVWWNLF